MGIRGIGRLKSWMDGAKKPQRKGRGAEEVDVHPHLLATSTPVDNFYRHRARNNLHVLYRFALQSRSIAIRDVLARASSDFGLGLQGLLWRISEGLSENLNTIQKAEWSERFDPRTLLTLADLLVNTNEDDLDVNHAVNIYNFVFSLYGVAPFEEANRLQFVEALNDLGAFSAVEDFGEAFEINSLATLQMELLRLQKVRRTASVSEWLEALNTLYDSLDMSEIQLLEDERLPLLDRLTSNPAEVVDGPTVSVIVPTYAPGKAIWTAVRGLLQQTWKNLEIIIVNDASPENYRPLYDEIERLDPRIKVLHQATNAGAYVARNAGLQVATGEFVTTHDDDDWSHPEKISTQLRLLLERPEVVATTSAHIRVTEDMELRRVNIQAKYMQMNYSSLMFRRSVINQVGQWDTVNRGGDSEFYTRLLEYYGAEKVVNLLDRPLSFSRIWKGSLTSGEMSRGFFAYSRLLYRWAFRQWHWDCGKAGEKAVRVLHSPRPYAIPTTFEAGKRNDDLGRFDVVYVTDFFRQAKYVDYVLRDLRTLAESGLRVGYVHLNSPETLRPAGFLKELFELQREGKISQISEDDTASTDLLVVYDPSVGMFLDRVRSSVTSKRAILVQRELPVLSGGQHRSSFDIAQSLKNLDACFGNTFGIVGATRADQEKIRQSMPKTRLLPDGFIWETHVRVNQLDPKPPVKKPVVGFHTYGNQYRWPNNTSQFQSVYSSSKYTTKFYGSVDAALQKFGKEAFDQTEIVPPDSRSEIEFLSDIDFWIYFPHSRLIDQVWEPVLCAMAAGKVVIMPHNLRGLYGDAGVYGHHNEVEMLVAEFASNPDRYVAQARRGQAFVSGNYITTNLIDRVVALISKETSITNRERFG